ncbi:hypothetical protein F4859DRAFT_466037 [Xylaria cf. heliscus]|nr:hypothetical protein F4859DRAFT_466037 [Xylaria cf. heliscus]
MCKESPHVSVSLISLLHSAMSAVRSSAWLVSSRTSILSRMLPYGTPPLKSYVEDSVRRPTGVFKVWSWNTSSARKNFEARL